MVTLSYLLVWKVVAALGAAVGPRTDYPIRMTLFIPYLDVPHAFTNARTRMTITVLTKLQTPSSMNDASRIYEQDSSVAGSVP